uniref:F-box domain-containing protein n=1 Tax=Compsopogon caeruleus TaxID=31354 RepID=A0A7S1T5C2_9RHOD
MELLDLPSELLAMILSDVAVRKRWVGVEEVETRMGVITLAKLCQVCEEFREVVLHDVVSTASVLRFDEEEEEGDGGCEDRIDIMQNLLEVVRHARGAVEVDFSRCVGVRLFNGPRGMKWMREVVEELGDRSRWNFQHSALVVDSVVKCLKDFRVLNLASTLHVTDSVFETWREKNCLQDLQVLSLRWARNVGTDQTLRILADHCRR